MFAKKPRKPKAQFKLRVELPTDVVVDLEKINPTTKVSQFKLHIEKELGIPSNLQRLSYLDAVDLPDATNLQHSDIVSEATIRLSTWTNWDALLCSSLRGDARSLLARGDVDVDGAPSSSPWHRKRAWTALYVAAHWGHFDVLLRMLERGVDVNERAPSGRTALHAAAYMGNWKCLCALLEKGADISVLDESGSTALDLAKSQSKPQCKQCERSLTFCSWNLQKKSIEERERDLVVSVDKLRENGDRRAHQFADSSLRTWLKGDQSQLYMFHTPNPFPCPPPPRGKAKPKRVLFASTSSRRRGGGGGGGGNWFDQDRAMDFVPSGRDLMMYSESALQGKKHRPVRVVPSPSSLRPPSITPSPLMFARRSVRSRSDSEARCR